MKEKVGGAAPFQALDAPPPPPPPPPSYVGNVPNDLVIEILSRLPKKSLARFSCVCRFWSNAIRNLLTPRLLSQNREWIEERLSNWTSHREMVKDLNPYFVDLFAYAELLERTVDLKDELEILQRLLAKFEKELSKSTTAMYEAQLLYFIAAKELFTNQVLKDMIKSDPKIIDDEWILEKIMSPHEYQVRKWLKANLVSEVKKKLRFCGEGTVEQLEEEEEDQEVNLSNEQKIQSLKQRLASAQSDIDRAEVGCGDAFEMEYLLRRFRNYCETRSWGG